MLSPKTKEIIERISEDRRGLVESVAGLAPSQVDFRPAPDAWSIADVLHHLALTEEAQVRLQSMFVERSREGALSPDPDPNRSVIGSIAEITRMADGRKAQAPDRVKPRSHVPAPESLGRLEASRARLLESVEALSEFDLRALTYRHPFFGELDAYQWLLVTGWHERRHRLQIERIRESPEFPRS